DELLDEPEGDRLWIGVAAEAVGERRPWQNLDDPPGAYARLKRARHGHFHTDDLAGRRDGFRGCGHAADESPAADRDHERVDAGRVLEDLERNGRSAGDHVRIVVRGDELRPAAGGERL